MKGFTKNLQFTLVNKTEQISISIIAFAAFWLDMTLFFHTNERFTSNGVTDVPVTEIPVVLLSSFKLS